jgi:hypothetical protein
MSGGRKANNNQVTCGMRAMYEKANWHMEWETHHARKTSCEETSWKVSSSIGYTSTKKTEAVPPPRSRAESWGNVEILEDLEPETITKFVNKTTRHKAKLSAEGRHEVVYVYKHKKYTPSMKDYIEEIPHRGTGSSLRVYNWDKMKKCYKHSRTEYNYMAGLENGHMCPCCNLPMTTTNVSSSEADGYLSQVTIDHYPPRASNERLDGDACAAIPMCRKCNQSKGSRSFQDIVVALLIDGHVQEAYDRIARLGVAFPAVFAQFPLPEIVEM